MAQKKFPHYVPGKTPISARVMNWIVGELRRLGNISGDRGIRVLNSNVGVTITQDLDPDDFFQHKVEIDPDDAHNVVVGLDRAENDYPHPDGDEIRIHFSDAGKGDFVVLKTADEKKPTAATTEYLYYEIKILAVDSVTVTLVLSATYPDESAPGRDPDTYWVLLATTLKDTAGGPIIDLQPAYRGGPIRIERAEPGSPGPPGAAGSEIKLARITQDQGSGFYEAEEMRITDGVGESFYEILPGGLVWDNVGVNGELLYLSGHNKADDLHEGVDVGDIVFAFKDPNSADPGSPTIEWVFQKEPQHVKLARLTVNNADGSYNGTEVICDDSVGDGFSNKTGGFSWGAAGVPALKSNTVNLDLRVSATRGPVVMAVRVYEAVVTAGDGGLACWVFEDPVESNTRIFRIDSNNFDGTYTGIEQECNGTGSDPQDIAGAPSEELFSSTKCPYLHVSDVVTATRAPPDAVPSGLSGTCWVFQGPFSLDRVALLTVDNCDGTFDALEQEASGPGSFITRTVDPEHWNTASNNGFLLQLNLNVGVDVSSTRYVHAWARFDLGAYNGWSEWVFDDSFVCYSDAQYFDGASKTLASGPNVAPHIDNWSRGAVKEEGVVFDVLVRCNDTEGGLIRFFFRTLEFDACGALKRVTGEGISCTFTP